MGTPRPAAGKEAVRLRLHSLNTGTLVELCQDQHGIADEPQDLWFDSVGQINVVAIRALCAL